MKQKAIQLSAIFSSHWGCSHREADQGKSGWLWPSEEDCTNTGIQHLSWKMGSESPHKPRLRWQGPKLRRGLLAGCVKLSNSWGREYLRFHCKQNGSQVCYLCERSTFNRLKLLMHDEIWKTQKHPLLQYNSMIFKLEVSKANCATSLLAQGSNTFKSHALAHPSLTPFQRHLLHLHSRSSVACFSLTHKPCGKEFCGQPAPDTIWHWDEAHWISQGFLCASQMWRGVQSNKTQSFCSCCSRTCPAHFVAETQLCRTVLFNAVSVQGYLSHWMQQA